MLKLPTKFKVTGPGLPALNDNTAGVYEMTVVANGVKQRVRAIASNGLGWEQSVFPVKIDAPRGLRCALSKRSSGIKKTLSCSTTLLSLIM